MDYTKSKGVTTVKVIGQFQEIYGKEYLPLMDQCEAGFYTDINAVVEYLRKGDVVAVAAGCAKDVITGENIPGVLTTLSKEGYAWRSDIAYYVEKYGLHLPEDFLKSINIH